MKTIRDAVHQNLELNDVELAVLDTPEMQRLRYVKQLSLAYLVYPSAVHTRFEHSLGTFHLTKQLASRLLEHEEEQQLLCLAALLHDVGHSAFSHLPEALVKKRTGKTHEKIGEEKILHSSIADALSQNGFSPKKLLQTIHSSSFELVSTEFGTDRIDYLLRDAHFTGVSYSLVDAERLLQSIVFSNGKVALLEKGVLSAESLLVSRYLMFRAVYHHHATRIASAMLQKALENALEEGTLSLGGLLDGKDDEILFKLQDDSRVQRILQRKLFKTAFITDDFTPRLAEQLEKHLSSHLQENEFVICSSSSTFGGVDVPVLNKEGSRSSLFKHSFLSQAISGQLKAKDLLVAASPEHLEKARKLCQKAI